MSSTSVPTLKPGTLVQVKKSALDKNHTFVEENRERVQENGWLWFVIEKERKGGSLYRCRSVATGEYRTWFENELNTKEQASEQR